MFLIFAKKGTENFTVIAQHVSELRTRWTTTFLGTVTGIIPWPWQEVGDVAIIWSM